MVSYTLTTIISLFSLLVEIIVVTALCPFTKKISFAPNAAATGRQTMELHCEQPDGDSDASTNMIEYDDFLPTPGKDLSATDVVMLCLNSLQKNIRPSGLEVCFNFSTDQCRAQVGGNIENFIEYANNPVFGSMVGCSNYTIVSVGPEIAGTPTRGAMQTLLVDIKPLSSEKRRFLFTLQKERRPPRRGFWLIHEVLFVENAYALTE